MSSAWRPSPVFIERKAAEIEMEAQELANSDLVFDDQRTVARRRLRHSHIVP